MVQAAGRSGPPPSRMTVADDGAEKFAGGPSVRPGRCHPWRGRAQTGVALRRSPLDRHRPNRHPHCLIATRGDRHDDGSRPDRGPRSERGIRSAHDRGESADGAFVSTGGCPPPERVAGAGRRRARPLRRVERAPSRDVYPALGARPARPVRHLRRRRSTGGAARRRRRRAPVHDPERVQAVRLRARLRARSAPTRRGERLGVNATGLPFNSVDGDRAQRGRAHQPDGEPGRHRHRPASCPGRRCRRALASSSATGSRASPAASSSSTRRSTRRSSRPTAATAASPTCSRLRRASTPTRPRPSTSTRASARCSVTARDLAVMGATLADGGVNPVTGERVVTPTTCQHVLAVLATAGLYERPATGSTTSACRARAASAAASSRSRPARAASARSRRRSTRRATACAASSLPRYLSQRLGLNMFMSDPFGTSIAGPCFGWEDHE